MDHDVIEAARLLLSKLAQEKTQGPTMGELWAPYWDCEGRHLKSARHVDFAWRLLCAVRCADGMTLNQRDAMSITPELVEELRTRLAVSPLTGRPLEPGTRNRNLYLIHRILNWSAQNRKIPYVPIPPTKIEPARKGMQTCIRTDHDFSRLMSCIRHPTFRVFVLVLFDSGMRFGEAIQIRRAQYSRRPGGNGVVQLTADQTKTARARRVYLSKRACDAIDSLPNRGPFIFARPDGKPYGYTYARRCFEDAVDRSGLEAAPGERLTMHRLRSSFVARARYLFRWPQSRIMKQTGHTTDAVFRLYGPIDEGEMTDSMDEVDAFLACPRIGPRKIDPEFPFENRASAKFSR